MNNSFIKKHKMLSAFFVFGVLAIVSASIIYQGSAAPTWDTWTQTNWSDGQSNDLIDIHTTTPTQYSLKTNAINTENSGELRLNRFVNPYFNDDLSSWDSSTPPEYDTSINYSGTDSGSAKFTPTNNDPQSIRQNVSLEGDIMGTDYNFSVYVYTTEIVPSILNMSLYIDDAIDTSFGEIGGGWYILTNTDPITLTENSPKTIGVVFADIAGSTIYFDDFSIYPTNQNTNFIISNIFDMSTPQHWENITYTTQDSDFNELVTVQARSGKQPDLSDADEFNLDCTDLVFDPGTNIADLNTSNCINAGDRYIQYYMELNNSGYFTPIVYDLSFTSRPYLIMGDTLSDGTYSTNEYEDKTAVFSIEFEGAVLSGDDATVDYTITGTATNGSDYQFIDLNGSLSITPGTPATIFFDIINDDIFEENETIIITLSNPVNAEIYGATEFTYTINDNDTAPFLTWDILPGDPLENHGTLSLEAMVVDELGAPITSGKDITIPITFSGTAVRGEDYTVPAAEDSITILAGASGATFDIEIVDDTTYEGLIDETIIVEMGEITNGQQGDPYIYTVNIIENDTIPTIAFTVDNSNNAEDISPVNIEVSLSGESSFDSQVDYIVTGGTATSGEDYILADSWITIPAGETTANISLTVVDNEIAEGAETIEITLSHPQNVDLGINTIHTYTINDDDVPGISATLDTIDGYTTEWSDGNPQRFEITLNTQPDSDVVIDVASTDLSEGTVDVPSLVFNSVTWNEPQYITVTGVDDDIADSDMPYQISLTIDIGSTTDTTGYAGLPETLINTTNMNEDEAGVFVTPTEIITYEYGGDKTFTVVLTSEPQSSVGILLESNNLAEGIIDKTELAFTALNWDIPQEVTITPQDDGDPEEQQEYKILITINTSDIIPPFTTDIQYIPIDPADVNVTNMDDDTPGIDVSVISGNTTEADGTATFTVVLESLPTDDVTIALSSDNENEGTVSPSSLTFTNADWNTPQTVTVTGVDDDIDDGDIAYNIITAAAVSDDGNYNGLNGADVAVTNENDDTAGITVSAITGDTNEDGGPATFTIRLNSEPLNQVAIPIASQNADEGTVNPTGVNFNAENWATPQTITVTGVNDNIVDDDIIYIINLLPAISIDPNYAGMDAGDVTVINVDNDTIGFTVTQSAGATNVGEGSNTDSYTIRLNTLPDDDVVVTITPDAQVTVNPTILTFTTANWNTNQTVTVTAVNDTVVEGNHNGIISHSVASDDLDYHGFALGNITAAITDNDTAPRSGGGGGGFWFPSSNPSETPVTPTPATDPQREQRLERLRNMGVAIHGLVKIPDDGNPNTTFDNIVYYVGTDGKRHVFPNSDIYKTWYDSFRYVRVYPMETLSQIPLGDNVRYKPGVKMIKFRSNNRVYAVEAGGKLRWIMNEKVAWYMYGTGWQKQIVNIPDSLFPSYEFADDISHSNQFDFVDETNKSQNISMDLGL